MANIGLGRSGAHSPERAFVRACSMVGETAAAKQVLLVHPGTQYAFHLAKQLHRHSRLYAFHTSIALAQSSVAGRVAKYLPKRLQARLANRRIDGVPPSKVCLHPAPEIIALMRFGRATGGCEEGLHARNAWFQSSIDRRSIEKAGVVIGFDTSSWLLADRCRRAGTPFILDQSIGHPRVKEQIFQELRRCHPSWKVSVPQKSSNHLEEEDAEHRLADLVVVPSSFVKATMLTNGVPEAKVRVIPFGTDLDMFSPALQKPATGKCVFLFVGSISARKGVPVLLAAWRAAQPRESELWLVGPGTVPDEDLRRLPSNIRLLGPKNRSEVANLMRRADIFVFPSFFEGLAQVQVEALASGLPLISTIEAGAEDLVRNGENGYLVPSGDVDALSHCLQHIASDRSHIAPMRQTVLDERSSLSWSVYGDRWATVLDEIG